MKKSNNCNLIEDLLPLYIEGLVSEKTKKEIEEHLKNCKKCSELLEDIKKDNKLFSIEEQTDNSGKEIKCIKNIKRKIILKIIISILVTIVITFICFNILNTYRIVINENGKYILYNFNTGNIKKGMDYTNLSIEYTTNNNGGDIKYSNLFTFNKDNICINTRTIISGYSDKELEKEYNQYKTVLKKYVTNVKIENGNLYMNENSYIGKKKEDIIKMFRETYDIQINEI